MTYVLGFIDGTTHAQDAPRICSAKCIQDTSVSTA
ncbi:hypothetical protein PC123_g8399 [Phytophthora cactorum]|nr:hypothetical protein PC123_g8399 [Phytophthora cactorum]